MVVDLPKDILNPAKKLPYSWPDSVSMRSYNPTTTGHKGQIKRALQTLVAAKKPVVYVGGGAVNAACHEQLAQIAEALNLPVVSSLMGLGAFPATHRQALGMLGMHGTYEANMTMHHSDVIFAVGVRFDDRTTNNWQNIVRMRPCCISISIRPLFPKPLLRIFRLWGCPPGAGSDARTTGAGEISAAAG